VFVAAPNEAQAVPSVLRPPSGKPWFFLGGLGGSFHLMPGPTDRFGRTFGKRTHAFKLNEEIGYHFSGDTDGPAIGAHFDQSFGDGYTRLGAAFKFWWDIQPKKDLGLYIAPFVHVGYSGWVNGHWAHTENTQFGAEGRLTLGQVGFVYFRPVAIDMYFGDAIFGYDEHVTIFYDVMLGGGVVW